MKGEREDSTYLGEKIDDQIPGRQKYTLSVGRKRVERNRTNQNSDSPNQDVNQPPSIYQTTKHESEIFERKKRVS
jgi:hypothetical protein